MDGGAWWAAVHGVAKSRTWLSDFTFTFHSHALKKEMATHSSVLAWRIPGTGEPGGLPSVGSHRVGHDWGDSAAVAEQWYLLSSLLWSVKHNLNLTSQKSCVSHSRNYECLSRAQPLASSLCLLNSVTKESIVGYALLCFILQDAYTVHNWWDQWWGSEFKSMNRLDGNLMEGLDLELCPIDSSSPTKTKHTNKTGSNGVNQFWDRGSFKW